MSNMEVTKDIFVYFFFFYFFENFAVILILIMGKITGVALILGISCTSYYKQECFNWLNFKN